MSRQLISHSPDLSRLRAEGYEVEVRGGYLILHHVPYLDGEKSIWYGMLISPLDLSGERTVRPGTHVIHFAGGFPCNKDGIPLTGIDHAAGKRDLGGGLFIDYSFSNKPAQGYADYYEKMSRYCEIISGPARSLDPKVTEKTFRLHDDLPSPWFRYADTNSARADIQTVNAKLEGQKVAIIGLGGTGAYVLDLLAKCPVAEIHLYDGDWLLQHNSFRSPGAASLEELAGVPMKVDYYASKYGSMHRGIVPHPYYITEDNLSDMHGMTYTFICLDRNSARKMIMAHLLKKSAPFIDSGLGVEMVNGALIGTVRVTSGTADKNDHIPLRVALEDREDDIYASNIQIADLNMLNAALAVLKWKKMSGFYNDLIQYNNCTYTLNSAHLDTTDFAA
jgi:hypothetical protein